MSRRWCIPLAALTLTIGSALAATAATASAATFNGPATAGPAISSQISPGGPIGHLVRPAGAHGAAGVRAADQSTNWSGYAATSGTFTSVSSSWTEPTGHCTASNQFAAFWVGLDGFNSSSVEQTGTLIQCSGTTPQYLAWYEMFPANPVYFNETVRPGDHMTGSVTFTGGSSFTLKLSDSTRGWSQTVNKSLSGAARSSAEVIVEAPCCTSSGGPLPLANFGTASFTGATANGTAIGTHSPTQIIMVNNSGQDKDSVSGLSSNANFSATWLRSN